MNRKELESYITETYSVSPEYLWKEYPSFAIFRHNNNKKWFALLMCIPGSRLGLPSEDPIDIINVKCDPILIGSLRLDPGFYPAYHMSREHWISIALNGQVSDEQIRDLLELSYRMTVPTMKKRTSKKAVPGRDATPSAPPEESIG